MKAKNSALSAELSLLQKERRKLLNAHKRLAQRNESLRHFLYTVSHNIKAPIDTLNGLIGVMAESAKDAGELGLTNKLRKTVLALEETIKDLVRIIDIQENTEDAWEELSLQQEVDHVCVLLARQITHSKASIQVYVDQAPRLYTVRPLLTSILLNLINNAIKYRSPDRALLITISAKLKGRRICIEMCDNGVGIDTHLYKNHIFGLYKRFGNTSAEGRGVGLFLVKLQVGMLGGSIRVKSRLDGGSCFTLLLPASKGRRKFVLQNTLIGENTLKTLV